MKVLASAPAKVNLALRVGGPRPDGFHPLDTVFEALDLYDDVEATLAEDLTMSISGLGEDLPVGESNLVIKAARLLQERYPDRGINAERSSSPAGAHLAVTKRIPVAGGMAGGSADAAATLVALNALWQLELPSESLHELACELGSDVPFALFGSIAHGTGRGESLRGVHAGTMHGWVILTNPQGLSTPDVFREFDRLFPDAGDPEETADLRSALEGTDLRVVGKLLKNDLQPAAMSLRPDLGEILESIARAGAGVILSGSGPSIAILTDPSQVQELASDLASEYPDLTVVTAHGPAAGAHVRVMD